jgi:hypothetical protein
MKPLYDDTPPKEKSNAGPCQLCGRGPAIKLKIRRSAGIGVFTSLHTSNEVSLCKECGLKLLRQCQVRSTLTAYANPFFAPYAIGQNAKWASRLKKLPNPV